MKVVLGFIGLLFGVAALSFGLTAIGWVNFDFWGTKFVNTEHKIFKQSEPFIDGQIRELTRLQLQYEDADEGHKKALRSLILTEASTINEDELPANLRGFLSKLHGGVS